MAEIPVAPKPTTVTNPLGLMVTTLASVTNHFASVVTSFVVLSLNVAVAVSCVVSPILVNMPLPLIVTRVAVNGVEVAVVVGAMGGTGARLPQPASP